MIQTIHIGHLLRETVSAPYRNLVTRPTGAAIRGRIQAALAGSDCPTAMLDFSGIDLLDFSCADEVVAKLLLADDDREGRYVVLCGLREDQHEAIDHVLTHHRLAVAAIRHEDAEPGLIGWVTADARVVFGSICERGPQRPVELAQLLDWPAARTEAALETLALHRLVQIDGDHYRPLPIA
jgi:hypothetical protein